MRSIQLIAFTIFFSFFAVYTIVWAILEPIPIADKYQCVRLYAIIILSLIVAATSLFKRGLIGYIFYRYIRPYFTHELQSLSTRAKDDPLSQAWHQVDWSTGQANPIASMPPEIVDDILFNKACRFHDSKTHDATHGIKVNAKERGTTVNYFLKPLSESSRENPVIYLRIILRDISDPTKEKNVPKWLTLVIDKIHTSETIKHSDVEETVFISSKNSFMDWMFFTENIRTIVTKIERWRGQYVFNNIDSIKVRGSFELSLLTITK